MLKLEKNYDFRKRLCTSHKPIEWAGNACEGCYTFANNVNIAMTTDSEVATVAAEDFVDYLATAFGINAELTAGAAVNTEGADVVIYISCDGLGENANGYMGRRVYVTEGGVTVQAFDERGIAQALYSLEEEMNTKGSPCLALGVREERPAFSPRMIHSGYGMDLFPDEYLSVCAHHGYDALLVYVKDATHSAHGECDFNDIVTRAKKYGIDVYAYSALKNFTHPTDEGAKELFAELYGGLFRDIKGLRGMVFVGESIEFASNDPHVAKRRISERPADGIPDGKITPGWWPCEDYPEWLALVRDSIRAESPDADVVFWTYNFGYVEEKYRTALIKTLPTDISLLVTFEMFDTYPMGEGEGMVMDYTISHVGPGKYFLSEAKIAKERGIRLYSMVNTGGRTWDFGVIPYEPFPYQWNKRHEKLLEAREKYGLAGLMESHHFGFLPSFISRITKSTYTLGATRFEDKLRELAVEFAGAEWQKFIDGIKLVSESIEYYVPSDENQYGPFRIGPAYPLCLARELRLPNEPGVHHGNGIYATMGRNYDDWGRHDCYSLRIKAEIEAAKKSRKLVHDGLAILRTIKSPSEELERIINLVAFIERCYTTAINAKNFYIQRNRMLTAYTKPELERALNALEKIALAEIKNAKATIPLVRRDSAIGYEPSMAYQCDKRAIEWKLKQMDYMLDVELRLYRRSIDPSVAEGRYLKLAHMR